MLDCSVAKLSLVALSCGEAEFYGTVKGRVDIEANLTDPGTDPDAIGGDHCITPCVDVSPTCACAISCSLRYTTGMLYQPVFHDVL